MCAYLIFFAQWNVSRIDMGLFGEEAFRGRSVKSWWVIDHALFPLTWWLAVWEVSGGLFISLSSWVGVWLTHKGNMAWAKSKLLLCFITTLDLEVIWIINNIKYYSTTHPIETDCSKLLEGSTHAPLTCLCPRGHSTMSPGASITTADWVYILREGKCMSLESWSWRQDFYLRLWPLKILNKCAR